MLTHHPSLYPQSTCYLSSLSWISFPLLGHSLCIPIYFLVLTSLGIYTSFLKPSELPKVFILLQSGRLTVLLMHSLALPIWEWKALDSLSLILVSLWSAHQNLFMKSLSWLDMISKGRSFLQYQWLKNSDVNSCAVIVLQQEMRRMSAAKQSVMVTSMLKLSSSGSGPMKSIATKSPHLSGTGKGFSGPIGTVGGDL